MYKFVLASASPRRREILSNMGIPFEVIISDADESRIDKEKVNPKMYVQELALLKASAVCERIKDKNTLIIAADTVVFSNGRILGKPKDEEDAKTMLKSLSNTVHSVFTGICVMRKKDAFCVCSFEETRVFFKELSDEKINSYILSGEPMDKAGAYGIQGLGMLFVDKIEGDYFNVVGLPAAKLSEVLEKEFDIDLFKGEQE